MDELISFLYLHGLKIVIAFAILKSIIILLYRGLDIPYLLENFLVIYSDHGNDPNNRRRRFRIIHNIVTIAFYVVLLCWLAVSFVVKNLS